MLPASRCRRAPCAGWPTRSAHTGRPSAPAGGGSTWPAKRCWYWPLRNGDTHARLAAGYQLGISTVWRYVTETIDLIAEAMPLRALASRFIGAA